MVFPEQTNHYGTLFGGEALAWMDKAAFIVASRYARRTVVTASSEKCNFHVPVRQGQLVELVARIVATGKTSITVDVELHSRGPAHRRPSARDQGPVRDGRARLARTADRGACGSRAERVSPGSRTASGEARGSLAGRHRGPPLLPDAAPAQARVLEVPMKRAIAAPGLRCPPRPRRVCNTIRLASSIVIRPASEREPGVQRGSSASSASASAASSAFVAGPLTTSPSVPNRLPWQGQSHVRSAPFQCT